MEARPRKNYRPIISVMRLIGEFASVAVANRFDQGSQ
jgi:hypothetical protein